MGDSCPKALIQGGIIQGKMFRGWGGSEVQVAIAQGDFLMGGGGNCPGSNCPGGISSGVIVLGGISWGAIVQGEMFGYHSRSCILCAEYIMIQVKPKSVSEYFKIFLRS